MKLLTFVFIIFFAGASQIPPPTTRVPVQGLEEDVKLPNGKMQKEEILKADHKKNLEDAAELVKLSEELRTDLEKNDRYIVSIKTLKKTEEIEKLIKNIRGRLKRY